MIGGLGVMSFRMLTRLLHFCADRVEQSDKPRLLTQNPAQYQKTLNEKLIDNFSCFPTVIYTPSYNQRFQSYDFWKSTRSLKFNSKQIRTFWEFCNPDTNSKVILGNFHFQHHSWLSRLSSSCPCASIWLMVQKLRSFKINLSTSTLGLNEARSKRTLNIKVIGNYINSLKRVKT
jgi:hypothetical protein